MKKPIEIEGPEDPRLTAYALGELDKDGACAVEAWLESHPQAHKELELTRAMGSLLESELASQEDAGLTGTQRRAIDQQLRPAPRKRWSTRRMVTVGALAAAAAAGVMFQLGTVGERTTEDTVFLYSLFGDSVSAPTQTARKNSVVRQQDGRHRGPGDTSTAHKSPELKKEVFNALSGLGYTGDEEGTARPMDLGYAGAAENDSRTPRERRSVARAPDQAATTERYAALPENGFIRTRNDTLSTFSIDVDTASYANVRRFLLGNSKLPPTGAVRIEELINYFPYDYPEPESGQPFSVQVEIATAPWAPAHRLVKIGLKGRRVSFAERKNANLVFLLDVSGSMNNRRKLPLLVDAMSMLVENLDPSDRVAIVVYAGSSGLVLDSTRCDEKPTILRALERLSAGGSTNGGAGIELAYRIAQKNYVKGGVNRVILATDGDFNVGTTGQGDLERLITRKAKGGVFLSVLGFGSGNLQDATMETLADKGNGNYAYIDSKREARKVLVEELGGTIVTIAKDVKIQVEFNPAEVEAFRLIGYGNRMLAHQDFNDDTKDAGEIGSGHTVTALYEVVPKGLRVAGADVDPLRYQRSPDPSEASNSGELLTLKLRHKEPDGTHSERQVFRIRDDGARLADASDDFHFAASVAAFGMLLRDSDHLGDANWKQAMRLAERGLGPDLGGYRAEFLRMLRRAMKIARR